MGKKKAEMSVISETEVKVREERLVETSPTREVTIHREMNPKQFCCVLAVGKVNPGGARCTYRISPEGPGINDYELEILFQKGHPSEVGYNGILDSALLAVVIDRLQSFQKGPMASREGALALTKLEEALLWMDRRVAARTAQGVMNTYKTHKS